MAKAASKLSEIREHYQVEETGQVRMPYTITGKHGATYGLFRVNDPAGYPIIDGQLFAMSTTGRCPRLLGRSEWVRE